MQTTISVPTLYLFPFSSYMQKKNMFSVRAQLAFPNTGVPFAQMLSWGTWWELCSNAPFFLSPPLFIFFWPLVYAEDVPAPTTLAHVTYNTLKISHPTIYLVTFITRTHRQEHFVQRHFIRFISCVNESLKIPNRSNGLLLQSVQFPSRSILLVFYYLLL